MDHNNINPTEGRKGVLPLSPLFSVIFIVVAAAAGCLGAMRTGAVLFTLGAAAVFAYNMIALPHAALSFISPVITAVLLYIFSGNIFSSVMTAVQFAAIGAPIAVGIKKRTSAYTAVAVSAAAFIVVCIISLGGAIYIQYGNIIEGAKNLYSESFNAIFDGFSKALAASNSQVTLSEAQIKELLATVSVILPGFLIAVAELFCFAAYFLTGAFAKLCDSFNLVFPRGFGIKLSATSAIFFSVSVIMSLLLSTWAEAQIVHFTFFNISIVLFLPMTVEGIYRFTKRFKAAKKASLIRGTQQKPVLLIFSIILLLFINPLFPIVFASFFGAIDVIREAIKKSKEKKTDQ